ncbi:MAG: fibrobacter succinogenes major paralogous domain-containing protein [Candidatus Cloacimonetes bacterium]|nr:fibrobacter succinogenes major paralogous domain-containing protein [Candidatus Cloacimonadota bacterium]
MTVPYEYELDTGTGKNVNYTIYAKAFDTSNNNTNSETINILVCENGTVTDIDDNVYQTKMFGNQEWMVENLKVNHYRNGDPIPNATDGSTWAALTYGAYCYYNNNSSNSETYGALYNWYAVEDSRGLAPEGWHVPTDDEIKELEMYLGLSESQANSEGWRGTNEGSKLAGSHDLWTNGAMRNDPEFGSSGFDLIPGGFRNYYSGSFYSMGYSGRFWSSTENNKHPAWYRDVDYDYTTVYRYGFIKCGGFSVRCVKD